MSTLLKNKVWILVITLCFAAIQNTSAQSNKAKVAVDSFVAGAVDKGIMLMKAAIKEDPSDKNYNMLIEMYYYRYDYARQRAVNVAAQAISNSLGLKLEGGAYTDANTCFNELIAECRNVGLYSPCPKASQLLRNYFVDYNPDTMVGQLAKEAFEKGEQSFEKREYTKAKEYYLTALQLSPQYYKATIYLGDTYWYLNNMDSAIYYFQKGIDRCPDLLEPRKYLVDALGQLKQYPQAKAACLGALYIYPDESIFLKYRDIVKRENNNFDKHWVSRGCEVNSMQRASTPTTNDYWRVYQNAGNKIKKHCNNNGIITKKHLHSKYGYMEVYCWNKMLSQSKKVPEELQFAKKMQEEGYLDCYVFISLFHFDCYSQYQDFVKNNKERIQKYVETYLVGR